MSLSTRLLDSLLPASEPSDGYFDDILDQMLSLDPIPGYLETRRTEVPELQHWLKRQQFERIRAAAHNMKRHAGNLGLTELETLGASLEIAASQSDPHQVTMQLAALGTFLEGSNREPARLGSSRLDRSRR